MTDKDVDVARVREHDRASVVGAMNVPFKI